MSTFKIVVFIFLYVKFPDSRVLLFLMKLPGLFVFGFLFFFTFAHENNLLSRTLIGRSTEYEDSPGFIKAATIIKESINESVDPCEDFFEFSCGKWIANNPIPDDHTSYSHFDVVREKIYKEMKDLYEDDTPSTSNAINDLKKIYAACMDIESINKRKSHDLNKAIQVCYPSDPLCIFYLRHWGTGRSSTAKSGLMKIST